MVKKTKAKVKKIDLAKEIVKPNPKKENKKVIVKVIDESFSKNRRTVAEHCQLELDKMAPLAVPKMPPPLELTHPVDLFNEAFGLPAVEPTSLSLRIRNATRTFNPDGSANYPTFRPEHFVNEPKMASEMTDIVMVVLNTPNGEFRITTGRFIRWKASRDRVCVFEERCENIATQYYPHSVIAWWPMTASVEEATIGTDLLSQSSASPNGRKYSTDAVRKALKQVCPIIVGQKYSGPPLDEVKKVLTGIGKLPHPGPTKSKPKTKKKK